MVALGAPPTPKSSRPPHYRGAWSRGKSGEYLTIKPGALCKCCARSAARSWDTARGRIHSPKFPGLRNAEPTQVERASFGCPNGIWPPGRSIRGNVKRKYFSLELKCAEDWSRHSAPPTRFCPVRCDVIVRGRLRPGMRVGGDPGRIFLISAPAVAWSGPTIGRPRRLLVCTLCLSLLVGMRSSERPGTYCRPSRPIRTGAE